MTNSPEGAHHESDQTQPINIVPESTEQVEAVTPAAPTPHVQESPASTGPVFDVPASTPVEQTSPVNQRAHDVRFSTIVWGLIVAFAGAIIVLAALGISFDMQLVAIIALGISGVVLLGGALVRAIRA